MTEKNSIQKPSRKRTATATNINRLQNVNPLQADAEPAAPPTKPVRRKLSKECHFVTKFDKSRNAELSGLYMPANYVEDIVQDLEAQCNGTFKVNYFDEIQTDIKPRMRTILFGWLTEVHAKFQMKPIVLWHTFQLVDEYLRVKAAVKRTDFQMLGCAALWVASKYHEIYPPVAQDLVHMSDRAFTKTQLVKMESELCDKLGYDFTKPTPFQFLERYTDIAIFGIDAKAHKKLDAHTAEEKRLAEQNVAPTISDPLLKKVKRVKFLARYALERWNLRPESLGRPAKHMAAQALHTAMSLTSNKWTPELVKATGFTEGILRKDEFAGGSFAAVKKVILDFFDKEHDSIIRKYKHSENGSVSTLRKKNKAERRS